MKRYLIAIPLILLVVPVFSEDAPRSIDAVISDIRQELKLKAGDTIDPAKVSEKRLEELGDSVMEVMAGSRERHEWMDKMMGGEGSPQLADVHRRMGYRYLSGGGFGMMGGPGFPGYSRRGGNMMNGWFGYGPMMGGWFGWWPMVGGLFGIALTVLVIVFAVRVVRHRGFTTGGESAQDILKKRYARGEITKQQFEDMKKDL